MYGATFYVLIGCGFRVLAAVTWLVTFLAWRGRFDAAATRH